MKRSVTFGILFLVTLLQLSHNQETLSIIKEKCSLQDSACLTKQAQNALQAFVEGIPKLGIKTIDQLLVDPIIVHIGNLSYEWHDIKVSGLANAIIDDVSINMLLKIMRVSFHTTIDMELNYSADGPLFSSFQVHGSGPGKITLNKMQMEILFVFDIVKDNGKDFMDLKTYYYGFDSAGGVEYHFNNMFDGDEKKSEVLHKLINTNWRTIVANFGGYFNRKMTDKLFEAVKIFMRSESLDNLAIY